MVDRKRKRAETTEKQVRFTINKPHRERALQSCLPEQWLVDDVINFFIFFLNERLEKEKDDRFVLFNTYFWNKLSDPESLDRLTKWKDNKKLWQAEYWLIPVHENKDHWCLCIVSVPKDLTQCKELFIYVLDSLKAQPIRNMCKRLRGFIATSWKKNHPDQSCPKHVNLIPCQLQVPMQSNGYDCGVFLLMYIRKYIENPISTNCPDWFRQESIKNLRGKLYNAIKQNIQES